MRIYSGISIESTMRSFILLRRRRAVPERVVATTKQHFPSSSSFVVAVADFLQIELNFFLISSQLFPPPSKSDGKSRIDSSI